MKKKAAYYAFSALLLFSGAFSIAPMAFCVMKAAPKASCCSHSVPAPTPQCPICVFDQNKTEPNQANLSVASFHTAPNLLAILPHDQSAANFSVLTDYRLASHIDTSPPLYLEYRILRL